MPPRVMNVVVLAVLLLPRISVGEEAGLKLKSGVTSDAIRFVTNTSDDGLASTTLFDNFLVELPNESGSLPHSQMKTLTCVRSLEGNGPADVELHLRGFVDYTRSTDAILIVHAGRKTTVIDLQKAIQAAGGDTPATPTREGAVQAASTQGFQDKQSLREASDDFLAIVRISGAGEGPFQATVILRLECASPAEESGALLVLDSIDMVVAPAAEAEECE